MILWFLWFLKRNIPVNRSQNVEIWRQSLNFFFKFRKSLFHNLEYHIISIISNFIPTSVRNKLCRIAKCDALLNICDSVLHACSIKMRRQKNLFFLLFHTMLHHQKLSRTNLQRIGIYLPKISTKKYDKKSFQLSTRFVVFLRLGRDLPKFNK